MVPNCNSCSATIVSREVRGLALLRSNSGEDWLTSRGFFTANFPIMIRISVQVCYCFTRSEKAIINNTMNGPPNTFINYKISYSNQLRDPPRPMAYHSELHSAVQSTGQRVQLNKFYPKSTHMAAQYWCSWLVCGRAPVATYKSHPCQVDFL